MIGHDFLIEHMRMLSSGIWDIRQALAQIVPSMKGRITPYHLHTSPPFRDRSTQVYFGSLGRECVGLAHIKHIRHKSHGAAFSYLRMSKRIRCWHNVHVKGGVTAFRIILDICTMHAASTHVCCLTEDRVGNLHPPPCHQYITNNQRKACHAFDCSFDR